MRDFHKMLGFDEVYDESFTQVFPIFQKLGIQKNYTIASESGYFVNLLNENGIQSAGSDIFSPVVKLSQKRYPHIDFSIKDMRDFTLDQKVELITCMDGCINHVFSLEEVFEVCSSVYRNLEEKGFFYFEFWTEEEVSKQNPGISKKTFSVDGYKVTQTERRVGKNIHNMMTEITKDGEIIEILNAYHTSFDYESVKRILLKAGFKKSIELSFSTEFSKKILAFKY